MKKLILMEFIMILAGCCPASPESQIDQKSANAKQLIEHQCNNKINMDIVKKSFFLKN